MPRSDRKRCLESFNGDYFSGWAFKVHKAFRDQLDIELSKRVITKPTKGPRAKLTDEEFIAQLEFDKPPCRTKSPSGKVKWKYGVWTQGECYCFDRGHMLHTYDGGATIQVDTAEPATNASEGFVRFVVFHGTIPAGMATVPQKAFVAILKTGHIPNLHEGYTFDQRFVHSLEKDPAE
jgi:hypothetical protein